MEYLYIALHITLHLLQIRLFIIMLLQNQIKLFLHLSHFRTLSLSQTQPNAERPETVHYSTVQYTASHHIQIEIE